MKAPACGDVPSRLRAGEEAVSQKGEQSGKGCRDRLTSKWDQREDVEPEVSFLGKGKASHLSFPNLMSGSPGHPILGALLLEQKVGVGDQRCGEGLQGCCPSSGCPLKTDLWASHKLSGPGYKLRYSNKILCCARIA